MVSMTTPRMMILAVETIPSHRRPLRPPGSRTPWINAQIYGLRPSRASWTPSRNAAIIAIAGCKNEAERHRTAGPIENVASKDGQDFRPKPHTKPLPGSRRPSSEHDRDARLPRAGFWISALSNVPSDLAPMRSCVDKRSAGSDQESAHRSAIIADKSGRAGRIR